jgi:hypothetical protein
MDNPQQIAEYPSIAFLCSATRFLQMQCILADKESLLTIAMTGFPRLLRVASSM